MQDIQTSKPIWQKTPSLAGYAIALALLVGSDYLYNHSAQGIKHLSDAENIVSACPQTDIYALRSSLNSHQVEQINGFIAAKKLSCEQVGHITQAAVQTSLRYSQDVAGKVMQDELTAPHMDPVSFGM